MIIQFPILNISLSTLSSLDLEETHIGDFDSYGSDPRRIQYAGSETDGLSVDYKVKYAGQLQVIKDNYATFAVPYNGEDNNDYVDGKGFCCNDGSLEAAQARAMAASIAKAKAVYGNFKENDDYEKMQFYYHPDHLGSSSYITNLDGEVVQHIEYVPFGEVFVEERNNIWNTPYLFNAKEFDEETGLYYYGARYYDPRLSLWISCDPQEENYPAFNSYCYTANNPIRYIDTDGEKIVSPKGNIVVTLDKKGKFHFTSNATASIKRVTKALSLTPKGREMLTMAVKSDINVSIIISSKSDIEVLSNNRKSYTYGTTMQGNSNSNDNYGRWVDKNGKYRITSATITIFEGTLIEDAKTSNPKHEGLTLEQAIGAVAGHEIIHATDKNEIHKDISYEMKHRKGTRKDKEVKARQVEDIIIEQSKNKNNDNQ